MKDGATTEVIESHPIANAKVPRSRATSARRQAGTERTGPRRRKGLRTFTRSDTRPRTTAAIPAAREKSADGGPSGNGALGGRNEPNGAAERENPAGPR